MGARDFPADLNSHLTDSRLPSRAHDVQEVFVALETERLCKFVSLVMFVPGEYISGALQAQSSSAYSSSTDEG